MVGFDSHLYPQSCLLSGDRRVVHNWRAQSSAGEAGGGVVSRDAAESMVWPPVVGPTEVP